MSSHSISKYINLLRILPTVSENSITDILQKVRKVPHASKGSVTCCVFTVLVIDSHGIGLSLSTTQK